MLFRFANVQNLMFLKLFNFLVDANLKDNWSILVGKAKFEQLEITPANETLS